MTTMAITESFDAPMMDFSGEDILMQTSSSMSWIHPEATMDDDPNLSLNDVEIDMENYHPETFEYEMTDDSSAQQPVEVHDVEVIDISQAHTPTIIDTVVEDATTASPVIPEHDLPDTHDRSPLDTPPTLVIQVPSPTSQPAQDGEHLELAVTESFEQSEWDQSHSELPDAPPSPRLAENHQPQNSPEPASLEAATETLPNWDVGAPVEQQTHLRQPTPTPGEQLQSTHEESAEDRWGEDENPVPSRASSGDPHEVLDGIFIDPPPPVLLSLGDSEREYYLFNRPAHKPPVANDEGYTDGALFLHDLPTLYYEPLAKVFQALRSDVHLNQAFDLSRGELIIDAYDLVDLVISEDNLYSIEVSFHDLNLLHDQADLAGPLRIRVACNPRRFITRYRELKSKLEQFNLLDETTAEDDQLPDQGERDFTEQLGIKDAPEYLAQDEEGYENPTSEGLDQATTEHPADNVGSDAHTVDRSDEGESSDEVESEQVQPAGGEEHDVGPLSGDEHTEQPVGVAEGDSEQGTAGVTASDNGDSGSAEDLDAVTIHEHSDVHDTQPLGGKSTEYEDATATDQDYEADYNENDQETESGETVAIEGDARGGDWDTTASEAQQTHDDLEQHEGGDDTTATDKSSADTDLAAPGLDDDPTVVQHDTDTDSIGQQTLDEFVDAQDESQDGHRSHEEGEESNSNTDGSKEPIPGLDQFGDGFDWDEDFGGDFDDGELGEFEDPSKVETKRVGSQEPISGRSSKRAYDELSSDTADEEEGQGDVSPNSKRKKVL